MQAGVNGTAGLGCTLGGAAAKEGAQGRWADEAVFDPSLFLCVIHFSPSAPFLFGAFFTLD